MFLIKWIQPSFFNLQAEVVKTTIFCFLPRLYFGNFGLDKNLEGFFSYSFFDFIQDFVTETLELRLVGTLLMVNS